VIATSLLVPNSVYETAGRVALPGSQLLGNRRTTITTLAGTARSARFRNFAELAELSNREELYRPPPARQYRNVGRKFFPSNDLPHFMPPASNFRYPANSRLPAHLPHTPQTLLPEQSSRPT